ncbi:hypothetical protein Tsubulata_023064 [Turnera subulata]|uniref:CCHC-type domain-containing protein n=1 Tax=Turnera subulata TaxID=218843 RepID=A0A9Q0G0J0_9ROSI|nr:hypothetical protein Tsubulata_023064 [Turnera subulata]
MTVAASIRNEEEGGSVAAGRRRKEREGGGSGCRWWRFTVEVAASVEEKKEKKRKEMGTEQKQRTHKLKRTTNNYFVDLENNYFVVRFWDVEDFHKALLEGPWTIFTHVLSVQPWTQTFRASSNTIDKVVTWVRFVDFPLDRYHSHILRAMGDLVGTTVKLDKNADNPDRGKSAKGSACVDLTQPLAGKVTVAGESYKVVYEGLPNICGVCGKVGHLSAGCPEWKMPPTTSDPHSSQPSSSSPKGQTSATVGVDHSSNGTSNQSEDKGEWMNAPRGSIRPPKRQMDGQPAASNSPTSPVSVNRFQVFNESDFSLFEMPTAPSASNSLKALTPFTPSFPTPSPPAYQKKTQ